MLAPPKTDFAPLLQAPDLPLLSPAGQAGYKVFLSKDMPRAFAVAPGGSWAWADGGNDPLKRALDRCNIRAEGRCKLYAVDNDVVWTNP